MVFFALACVFFLRLRQLGGPTGADGFFYLKQILDLSEHHSFYYKDYSFGFFLPVTISFFVHDPLLSYQISTCVILGGIAWAVDRLVRDGFSSRVSLWLFRGAAALFYCYSLPFLDLNFVFLKTATAVFFLLLAMQRAQRRALKSAALFLVLAMLSHKLALFLGLVALGVWGLFQLRIGSAGEPYPRWRPDPSRFFFSRSSTRPFATICSS